MRFAAGSAARGGRAGDSAQIARRREAQRMAGVVFALLVAASFAAFVVTQRLKHSPTAVQSFEMTPAFHPTRRAAARCRGPVPRRLVNATRRLEYLSFKLAGADGVTFEIVDATGGDVATIVRNLPTERYKQLSLCWNGQRGPAQRGGLAPPQEYRVRVRLHHQGLTRYSPQSFVLEPNRP
jgi:hypothetical protein